MYNITYAWRPTDRRPEADAGGGTPSRPPDACAQDTREARGHRLVRGAAKVRGRVGLVAVLTPHVGPSPPASNKRGARELRSALRGVWAPAQTPQAPRTVNLDKNPKARTTNRRLQIVSKIGWTPRRQRRDHPTSLSCRETDICNLLWHTAVKIGNVAAVGRPTRARPRCRPL